MVFVHNPVDKIGDNEYLIREYDRFMPDNAGEPFDSFSNLSKSYFPDSTFEYGNIVKMNNEPVFVFETSKGTIFQSVNGHLIIVL